MMQRLEQRVYIPTMCLLHAQRSVAQVEHADRKREWCFVLLVFASQSLLNCQTNECVWREEDL